MCVLFRVHTSFDQIAKREPPPQPRATAGPSRPANEDLCETTRRPEIGKSGDEVLGKPSTRQSLLMVRTHVQQKEGLAREGPFVHTGRPAWRRLGSIRIRWCRLLKLDEGGVAALRQIDADGIVLALRVIVLAKLVPQAPRLNAHERIDEGVERLRTFEDFQGDRVGLEPIAAPGQRLADDVLQEPLPPLRLGNGLLFRMRSSCPPMACWSALLQ